MRANIDGKTEKPNGAFGKSDIEGSEPDWQLAAMVTASELGSEGVQMSGSE
jgi:hypothetical protein